MANAPEHKVPLKAFIRRALESARKDIEQIERRFHRTIASAQTSTARRANKTAAARTRIASGSSTGRAAPVQTAITKVLQKRRRGLTMERLEEALPQFDQKSLLNATFAMRRKGLITFEKSGKGRGAYRWQEQV
jgi:predicted phage gp36 major capsid-like protein